MNKYIYFKKPTNLLHWNTEPLEIEEYCDYKLIWEIWTN